MVDIFLTENKLSLDDCYRFVQLNEAGGHSVFIGTVRNHTKGKTVLFLEFEAYKPMAEKEMRKIASSALEKFSIHKVAIHHRLGKLPIGDEPVIIAVSGSHRKEAFAACQYCIDTLKETVPIWKKEFFDDGEVWVAAHP